MPEDKFSILRTKTLQHEEFHRSRIMFCIVEGEVKIGPVGSNECHLDWFKKEKGGLPEQRKTRKNF